MNVFKRLSKIFFAVFFAWLSFFPPPIQEKYFGWTAFSLALIFLHLLVRKGKSLLKRSDVFLGLFLVSAIMSLSVAVDVEIAFRFFLLLFAGLFFIYYWIAESFRSGADLIFLAKVICICSIVVAFWGILDSFLGVNLLYETVIPNTYYDRYQHQAFLRAIATQFHAPPLGTYLIASLPFSFMLIKQKRLFLKGLGFAGTILIVPASILTCSRGVFLGLFAMVLCLLFFMKKRKWIILLFAGAGVFIFISSRLFYPLTKFGVEGLLGPGDSLFSAYRLERIQMLGNILRDHPLWGLSFQHVRIFFSHYYPGGGMEFQDFMIMDNMYLTIAAEMGLVGFFSFLVFMISVWSKGRRALSRCETGSCEKSMVQCVLAGLVGLLVNAAAYELFYWPNQYMFFCVYIGLIERFYRISISQQESFLKKGEVRG